MPTPGMTASVSTTVDANNTAIAAGSGSLAVFATPMMIALMEQAACAAIAPALKPGQTSVGTQISAAHSAATPPGMTVTASATVTAVEGRGVTFAVTARDGAGEIGRGTHTRFIVDAERFIAKASAKLEG